MVGSYQTESRRNRPPGECLRYRHRVEMELTGEPIDAQRALSVNLVSRVVPHDDLMKTTEDLVGKILKNPRRGVESAKETIVEVSGRPVDDQLRIEALLGYSIMDDPGIGERAKRFLERADDR